MDKLEGKALKAYKSESYPKFLATVDKNGIPNIVPVLTLQAVDPSTLIFGRLMVWKTAQNLETTRIATACCFGPGAYYWRVRADFVEFAKKGPHIELLNEMSLFRYNAYAGASEAGVFRVKEVLPHRKMNWAAGIIEMMGIHRAAKAIAASKNGGPMPPKVIEHFNRRLALKYIAYVNEDGWPEPQPVFSLFPAGAGSLVFKADADLLPPPGTMMAASAINQQLIAYQVKGRYRGREKIAGRDADILDVTEVFTASPPLPGKRVFPPQ